MIVDPSGRTLIVHILFSGGFGPHITTGTDKAGDFVPAGATSAIVSQNCSKILPEAQLTELFEKRFD